MITGVNKRRKVTWTRKEIKCEREKERITREK